MTLLSQRAGAVLTLILASMACMSAEPVWPVENAPQSYRTVRNWGQFPDVQGIVWPAALTAVEPDRSGNIYVIYRCRDNSCAGRTEDPILKFDKAGKLLAKWGSGLFVFPHGATSTVKAISGLPTLAAPMARAIRYSSSVPKAKC